MNAAAGGFLALSLIVPAFNEEKYLGATLRAPRESARHLPRDQEVEVVVVDDGSSAGTRSVAEPLADRLVEGCRQGIAAARNAGAATATGRTLVFVDADTVAIRGLRASLDAVGVGLAPSSAPWAPVQLDFDPIPLGLRPFEVDANTLGRP